MFYHNVFNKIFLINYFLIKMSAYPAMAKFKTIDGKKIITNYNQVFKNISTIGRGSNGVVWKIQDIQSGKYYALKQVIDYDDDTLREIDILRTFSREFGSSVVKYYDYFFYQHKLSILMEYIEGITVGDFFRKGFGLMDFVNFAIWLTNTVAMLHNKGYVHRDIKPANIMVTKEKYKLIDFGYSCRVGKPTDKLSCKLSSPGSNYYAAPELYTREYEKDMIKYYKAIDVYACGVTLYRLLTGGYPYQLYKEIVIISPYRPIYVRGVSSKLGNTINDIIHGMVMVDVYQRLTAQQAHKQFLTVKQQLIKEN